MAYATNPEGESPANQGPGNLVDSVHTALAGATLGSRLVHNKWLDEKARLTLALTLTLTLTLYRHHSPLTAHLSPFTFHPSPSPNPNPNPGPDPHQVTWSAEQP